MDGPRIVYPPDQTDRDADAAFRFACGGCVGGFALGVLAAFAFLFLYREFLG